MHVNILFGAAYASGAKNELDRLSLILANAASDPCNPRPHLLHQSTDRNPLE